MATPRFDYERASLILFDALFCGDENAAILRGVSVRTVERYRKRLQTDDKLAEAVGELRDRALKPKQPQVVNALATLIEFIHDATKHLDRGSCKDLMAVVEAFQALSEIELMSKLIDARLAGVATSSERRRQRVKMTL